MGVTGINIHHLSLTSLLQAPGFSHWLTQTRARKQSLGDVGCSGQTSGAQSTSVRYRFK